MKLIFLLGGFLMIPLPDAACMTTTVSLHNFFGCAPALLWMLIWCKKRKANDLSKDVQYFG
jgi:hypothetical protein